MKESPRALRSRRRTSITTKVNDEEYALLQRAAGGQPISAWARSVLFTAAAAHPVEQILVAELVALRTIVVNLQFAMATGARVTADDVRQLIERADAEKLPQARARLGGAAWGRGR